MAKTGVFLRGSRGKFAGSVLYKGEKGTVIRENVKPANPQTNAQMFQRIAFATCASAAKVMLPVIGQTFLGSANEKVNRRMFLAENVNKLREQFKNSVKGIIPDPAAATAKGYSVLVPNQYVMSKGTLIIPKVWEIKQGSSVQGDLECEVNGLKVTLPDGTYTAAEILKSVLGLEPGMQVSLVRYGCEEDPGHIFEVGDDYIAACTFEAKRLVVKNDLSGIETVVVADGMGDDEPVECLSACFDEEKSDSALLAAVIQNLAPSYNEGTGLEFDNDFLDTIIMDIGWVNKFMGMTSIISKNTNGSWDYSNSVMAVDRKINYGLKYVNAEPTYVKSASTASSKFTQAGGSSNSVG